MAPRIRFPIFTKVLLSCLLLAGLMIVLSYGWARYQAERVGRGRFMDAYLKRYLAYQQGMGQALSSVADLLASDAALRVALSPPSPAALAASAMLGGGDATKNTKEVQAAARARAAERAREIAEQLSGRQSIQPAIFVVFDQYGDVVFNPERSPIQTSDLRELEAVSKVRKGDAFFNELVLHGGKLYQCSGVNVRAWDGKETVGGVLLGVPIERHLESFKKQSDDSERDQVRLSLVLNNEVMGSVFPPETWGELAEAVTPNRRRKVKDGPDTIDVVAFDKQTWDYASERVVAYSGQKQVQLNMVALRSRAGLAKPQEWAAAALTGGGAALVVAFLLAAWITRPVRKFTAATEEISRGGGDLTQRIAITSNDELGDLATNLNRLFEHLHTLARDVQQASFQVGASSAEISAASRQMLEGAKDQAVKIEGSTAAVTELSTSIQQVASNAIEATKVAKQSNEAVSGAIRSMSQIRQTVDDAAEKIQDLGDSGKRIGNIVEVIRQISEQTSLLALNASIEAAHAGEQGRGFAVVADEVSNLAKRVGQSAKDIEDLIATIKDQTADAVRVMQTGTSEVERGTEQVTSTLENLKHIIDVVQDTANAVQEQALVSDEIARNMDAVQKIAGEVVSSSEEAVIQGEQLHKLAVKLEESVRGFNLTGNGAAAAPPAPPPPAADSTPMLPLPRAREARRS